MCYQALSDTRYSSGIKTIYKFHLDLEILWEKHVVQLFLEQ